MRPYLADLATQTGPSLRRLVLLRWVEIAALLTIGAVTVFALGVAVPLLPALAVAGAMVGFNFVSRRWARRPASDAHAFGQLLFDAAALTLLLFFSGGSTNPFVSLYLLPLSIAAATLPARLTWLMAALTLAAYTALLFYYVPLPNAPGGGLLWLPGEMATEGLIEGLAHVEHGHVFSLHVLGMWLNFVVSAGLIAYFVTRMAQSLRARDRALAAAREEALRNERIIALGTLAAGAAHELGTPLATVAVLAQDLQDEFRDHPGAQADLNLLRAQVERCKGILNHLTSRAGAARAEDGETLAADRWLRELCADWQLLQPGVPLAVDLPAGAGAPRVPADPTLAQALVNLLNNAARASPGGVALKARWGGGRITVEILDSGPGITAELALRAGHAPVHSNEGMGIGLLLSNATVERFGGQVRLSNRLGGGARVQVILPTAPAGLVRNGHERTTQSAAGG